jgi:predicted tellurium resistance membrane protein TerC
MDANELATFALLVGLELVLGIDNVLLISILTARLPASQAGRARTIGLTCALGLRVLMVTGASALVHLTRPVALGLSAKALALLAGGLFLLVKAVREIHHVVERHEEPATASGVPTARAAFGAAVGQIVLIDLVFSIDSVITAVGLTDNLVTIVAAVVLSFALVLAFASRVAEFINRNPALKILALAFLVTIGVTIVLEGLGHHVPKGYVYLPMAFALGVELLQMRHAARHRGARAAPASPDDGPIAR